MKNFKILTNILWQNKFVASILYKPRQQKIRGKSGAKKIWAFSYKN